MEDIDFQQYDVNGDEEVPSFRPVHRGFIPGYSVRGGKAALFQVFDGEPSWIESLRETLKEKGIDIFSPDAIPFAGILLTTIGILNQQRTIAMLTMAIDFLRDLADPSIDGEIIDEGDHWRWSRRYPRLSVSSRPYFAEFRRFQTAIGKFLVLPDLTKPHKTALEIKKQRDKDFAKLRIEFDLQHPGLKTA